MIAAAFSQTWIWACHKPRRRARSSGHHLPFLSPASASPPWGRPPASSEPPPPGRSSGGSVQDHNNRKLYLAATTDPEHCRPTPECDHPGSSHAGSRQQKTHFVGDHDVTTISCPPIQSLIRSNQNDFFNKPYVPGFGSIGIGFAQKLGPAPDSAMKMIHGDASGPPILFKPGALTK